MTKMKPNTTINQDQQTLVDKLATTLAPGDVIADGQSAVFKVRRHRDGFVTVWWAYRLFTHPVKRLYSSDDTIRVREKA